MNQLRLNNYVIKFLFFATLLVVACLFLFKGCDEDVDYVRNNSDSLKVVIAEQTKVKDSLLIISKKKDLIRVEIVTRWKIIKSDTVYHICDPIIKICDSIIVVDSSLISDLRAVIKIDSVIIDSYKTIVVDLTKEVKKQKKHKRWLMAGLIGLGIVAAVK